MQTAAFWIVAGTVVTGLGLGCFHLLGRPLAGWARAASIGHGVLGSVGVVLLTEALWRVGPGSLAVAFLAMALAAGAIIAVAQWRRRRPAGLVVALHAVLGVGGFLLLLGAG